MNLGLVCLHGAGAGVDSVGHPGRWGVLLRGAASVSFLQKAMCFQLKLHLASACPIRESGLEPHSQRASSTDGKHTGRTDGYSTQDRVGGLTADTQPAKRALVKRTTVTE